MLCCNTCWFQSKRCSKWSTFTAKQRISLSYTRSSLVFQFHHRIIISFQNNWSFRARATSSSGHHQPIQPDVLGLRGRLTVGRLQWQRRWWRPRQDADYGPAHCPRRYVTVTVFQLNCLLFRSFYFIQIHLTSSQLFRSDWIQRREPSPTYKGGGNQI